MYKQTAAEILTIHGHQSYNVFSLTINIASAAHNISGYIARSCAPSGSIGTSDGPRPLVALSLADRIRHLSSMVYHDEFESGLGHQQDRLSSISVVGDGETVDL